MGKTTQKYERYWRPVPKAKDIKRHFLQRQRYKSCLSVRQRRQRPAGHFPDVLLPHACYNSYTVSLPRFYIILYYIIFFFPATLAFFRHVRIFPLHGTCLLLPHACHSMSLPQFFVSLYTPYSYAAMHSLHPISQLLAHTTSSAIIHIT